MVKERKIRSFRELLVGSWDIFKKTWKNYLWLFLLETVATIVFAIVIFGDSIFDVITAGGVVENLDPSIFGGVWPNLLVGLIIFIPVSIGLQLAVYRNVYNGAENKEMTLKDMLKYGFTNIWPFFLVSLILGSILLGGYLLLIVPGIIFTLMFSMYYPVFVLEDVRGYGVLRRSKELTSGHKGELFGKYALAFLAYLVASIIVGLVAGLFGDNLKGLFDQILAYFTTPMLIAYTYLMYQDLQAAK